MLDMNQIVNDVRLTKVCSVRPNTDSTESKTITLEVTFTGVTLGDVFNKALSGAVIQWQNGPGRKGFDKLVDKGVVKINFSSPARTTIDPEAAMIAKLQSMTEDEKEAYINELIKKAKPSVDEIIDYNSTGGRYSK